MEIFAWWLAGGRRGPHLSWLCSLIPGPVPRSTVGQWNLRTRALRPTLGLRGAGWPSLPAHLCSTSLPSNGLPPWQEGRCWELGRPLFQVLAPGRRTLRLLIGVKWEHQTLISSLMEPGAWGSAGPCITLLPKPSWTLPVGSGAGGCRPSQSFWGEVCWPVTSHCHPGRHS